MPAEVLIKTAQNNEYIGIALVFQSVSLSFYFGLDTRTFLRKQ